MAASTIEVYCPKCEQTGRHQANCQDLKRLPVASVVRHDGFIETIRMHNGLEISNTAPADTKMNFLTKQARGFSVGRTLVDLGHAHVWQTYPTAFEETLFQDPQNSTARSGAAPSPAASPPSATGHPLTGPIV